MQIRIAIVFYCYHRLVRINRPWYDTFSSHTVEKQIRSPQYRGGHYCYLHGFLRHHDQKFNCKNTQIYNGIFLDPKHARKQLTVGFFLQVITVKNSRQTSSLITNYISKDLIYVWLGYIYTFLLLHFRKKKNNKFKSEPGHAIGS